MRTDERMTVYLRSLQSAPGPYLRALREQAVSDGVPIIRPEMESLLRMLLAAMRPKRILEVGTAVGYSALFMAECREDCCITTIEKDPARCLAAGEHFSENPCGDRITLLQGDACLLLKDLARAGEVYDFVFMDAAKGQYLHFLPEVLRLLVPGGMLVSDNVLQEGDIIESHYIVERRNRTIYKRMRDYLYELTHHPCLVTTVLPVADGAALSVRTEDSAGKDIEKDTEKDFENA